ncbi:tRNA glutamyl-Q(34) synthetase GluQRS [Canibacter sp. lx-45]|uniref:tRNA glutamyl-Q(34) synthetase GluQRS n=1 Tax=Canibacter zhuwentaonis TaxID=2837491 RepID=UPI001BDBD196|nr:tRNA glutamyl-Q(34) synthetase GluQRS [Canibacter zhuwentaonis]MBT1034943.1 tRNA glutamyl-Q(34) synthetase GluQRS [Canibacter zhuwentaonis]
MVANEPASHEVLGAHKPGAGRYAPSPSGDLHLGNLRTALVAFLAARGTCRDFLLRIDDIDRARDKGFAERQLADLRRLGIVWELPVMKQSERDHAYYVALQTLCEQDRVYECVCSRKDILTAPTAPHAPPGAYPGICRTLSTAALQRAKAKIAPRLPALRLKVAASERQLCFTDLIKGRVCAPIDDFVLRRGDGVYAYNLATVVDDAAAGVDQVVRGDDLASSTPRQILLARLLNAPAPSYAHVPLVVNARGVRLAKRDGAVTLAQLREQGVGTAEVLQMLLLSLGMAADPLATDALKAAACDFAFHKLSRDPFVFKGF